LPPLVMSNRPLSPFLWRNLKNWGSGLGFPEDQVHFFLLRWEYILGVDLPSGTGRLVGLRK
jgi:hypothetical protein